jgi:hypothetical protein
MRFVFRDGLSAARGATVCATCVDEAAAGLFAGLGSAAVDIVIFFLVL